MLLAVWERDVCGVRVGRAALLGAPRGAGVGRAAGSGVLGVGAVRAGGGGVLRAGDPWAVGQRAGGLDGVPELRVFFVGGGAVDGADGAQVGGGEPGVRVRRGDGVDDPGVPGGGGAAVGGGGVAGGVPGAAHDGVGRAVLDADVGGRGAPGAARRRVCGAPRVLAS